MAGCLQEEGIVPPGNFMQSPEKAYSSHASSYRHPRVSPASSQERSRVPGVSVVLGEEVRSGFASTAWKPFSIGRMKLMDATTKRGMIPDSRLYLQSRIGSSWTKDIAMIALAAFAPYTVSVWARVVESSEARRPVSA